MANRVVAGDYSGYVVELGFNSVSIRYGFTKLKLTKNIVESIEVITEEHRKSAASGVARGLVGGALLGPVGLLAGGISAKSKGNYQLAVQFKDGKNSLLEIDNTIYKTLTRILF
jgi:hypothetical protein